MPAAVAIVLTGVPAIGFAMAIPISITVCAIYRLGTQSLFDSEDAAEKEARTRSLLATLIFAAFSPIIIASWLVFTRLDTSGHESQAPTPSCATHVQPAKERSAT